MQNNEYNLSHPKLHRPNQNTHYNLKSHLQTLLYLQLPMAFTVAKLNLYWLIEYIG